MKKITLLSVFFFGILACTSQKQEHASQEKESTQLTQSPNERKNLKGLEESLKFLTSDELMGRDVGSEGLEKAAYYIQGVFEKNGIKPYLNKSYLDYFTVGDHKTSNVVGYLPGENSDLPPLIIGAHYDHVGIIKPIQGDSIANGANDNVSGTVTVLELAKYFSGQKLQRDVVFALFTAEEKGLLGSKHLSESLKKQDIKPYAVFNIEMVGVPMKGKDYLAYITGYNNSNFTEMFNNMTGKETLGFLPEAQDMNLFKRSDNYPFYETFKIPAHTICTFDFTNFDYYHHVNDEYKEINIHHIQNLIKQIQPGLLGIAQSSKNNIQLNN